MNNVRQNYRIVVLSLFVFASSFQKKEPQNQQLCSVKLVFNNTVHGSKIVLNDSTYSNAFGEKYVVTKLRYYVTNILLQQADNNFKEKDSYHLIDESKAESQRIHFSMPAGDYRALQFLLGVDSLHNVSGAQTDDLDPAKDMFWTWNTGYVMAKLEGYSPSSSLVNNKIEYHIGGFSGPYNVLKEVTLDFPGTTFHFVAGKAYEIVINADVNTWWQHPNDIKISEHAIITSPGPLARAISDNYSNMFHLEKISSN